MIGGIVFVAVLMAFGIIGNLHVLIVFMSKMKQSNHKTFICCLGVIDLIACTVSIPSTLLDLTHTLTYDYIMICKIARHLNYFICWSSAFILLLVTVDRYRKICKPMKWQLRNRIAKIICIAAVIVSVGVSLPAFFISGHRTVQTRYRNITGVQCSIDDKYINTDYPTKINIAWMVLASIVITVYIVLYALITRVILNRRRRNTRIKFKTDNKMGIRNNASTIFLSIIDKPLGNENQSYSVPEAHNATRTTSNCSDMGSSSTKRRHPPHKFRETKRLTIIFFVIVAIYFCSYIPNLIIKLITFAPYETFQHLEKPRAILYNTFTWFFYINNVSNPVVYFFLDVKFRKEIISFYGKPCLQLET